MEEQDNLLTSRWNADTIIDAIRRFNQEVGRAPRARDFEEEMSGRYPTEAEVANVFGTWAQAVRTAGFSTAEARPQSLARIRVHPAEMSISEIVAEVKAQRRR